MGDQPLTAEELLSRSVRFHRDRLRMTAKQLSDRISELGGSISRQAISKIELAERDVRLNELLFLARALNTSPLQLLFPLGQPTQAIPVEVQVAGSTVDLWSATRWFSGEVDYAPGSTEASWDVPLYLFRQHEQWMHEFRAYAEAPGQASTRDRVEALEALLRNVRGEMRRHGLTPPDLPPELADVDRPRGAANLSVTATLTVGGAAGPAKDSASEA